MPVLPYCVFLDGPIQVPKTGVQGAELQSHSASGLTVLYSDLDLKSFSQEALPRAVLEFWEVIRRIFEQRAVIPFRFPTRLSKAELREHLNSQQENYSTFLRQFANYVQMEIRVTLADTGDDGSSASLTGTEYMMNLQRSSRRILAFPATFEQITQVKARSWRHRKDGNAVRMFALIEREKAAEFGEKLAGFRDAKLSTRVSGPWPATEFLP